MVGAAGTSRRRSVVMLTVASVGKLRGEGSLRLPEAARARREEIERPAPAAPTDLREVGPLTLNELLDIYLEGLRADNRLSIKAIHDYEGFSRMYVRPSLGHVPVRDLTPDLLLSWQRRLSGHGKEAVQPGLAPNTIRLARAPLAGALKLAVSQGIFAISPLLQVSRPKAVRKVARHWSPEQARAFLVSQEGDRLYPIWAFLMGCGLRIGEVVWLTWSNVDLVNRRVRIVDFATTLGWELVSSPGKSSSAVRTVDIDDRLVAILVAHLERQRLESTASGYLASDFVFTKPTGGSWHPATLSKVLARRSEAAALPRLTAHGLRHTSASLRSACKT